MHGDDDRVKRLVGDLRSTHFFEYSLMDVHGAGGIAILAKTSILEGASSLPHVKVLEKGRVMSVKISYGDNHLWLNNVHYQDFQQEQATLNALQKTIAAARHDPSTRSLAVTAGDFNFLSKGEQPVRIAHAGAAHPNIKSRWLDTTRQRKWAPVLAPCVEIYQGEATRMGKAKNAQKDAYWIASRLDRIYFSWSPWQFSLATVSARTVGNLAEMGQTADSDHVGVGVKVSTKSAVPPGEQPLPRWLVNHTEYKRCLTERLEWCDLSSLAPYEALRKVKLIMRQAGKQAQRNLSDGPPETAAQKMQLILQLARGIATQDAIITEKVLVKLPLLQRAVQVVNCAQVVVSDQQALDNFSMEVANEALELEKRKATEKNAAGEPRDGRMAALSRLLKVWFPFSRKAVSVSIIKAGTARVPLRAGWERMLCEGEGPFR
jgi:hypothetical protein